MCIYLQLHKNHFLSRTCMFMFHIKCLIYLEYICNFINYLMQRSNLKVKRNIFWRIKINIIRPYTKIHALYLQKSLLKLFRTNLFSLFVETLAPYFLCPWKILVEVIKLLMARPGSWQCRHNRTLMWKRQR